MRKAFENDVGGSTFNYRLMGTKNIAVKETGAGTAPNSGGCC